MAHSFKKGDSVICISKSYTKDRYKYYTNELEIGKEYIVSHTFLDDEVIGIQGLKLVQESINFELKKMNKFKVGDKVIRTGYDYNKVRKGEVYTVSDSFYNGLHTDIIRVSIDNNNSYDAELFELYNPSLQYRGYPMLPRYRPGDIIIDDKEEKYYNKISSSPWVIPDYIRNTPTIVGLGDMTYYSNPYLTPEGENLFTKIKHTTMNIVKYAKNLTLSKEDKLLREVNLVNDCGDYTDEAKQIVINKMCEDNKTYLVTIATQIKEENKETK